MTQNPILIVDDDSDDIELIAAAAEKLSIANEMHFFSDGIQLREYLLKSDVSPFLIICDVNIPLKDGFAIRQMLSEDPQIKYKSVPFIFWSTGASDAQIKRAYDLPAQGFFFKPDSFEKLCKTLERIVDYWSWSQHPKKL
jgi:CheY-like chemotaxis protein